MNVTFVSSIIGCLLFVQPVLHGVELHNPSSRLGIVKERPQSGRFVEVECGFMVPYTVSIPGTDAQIQMVPIPGGTVYVGSPESEPGRKAYEGPQVPVVIEPFWMGKFEVTWAEFEPYMAANFAFKRFDKAGIRKVTEENKIDAVTAPSAFYDPSLTYEAGDELNTPAATMTQYSAKQYTKWLSLLCEDFYRLPSEAEWEHAARAGARTTFFFGNDVSKLAEYAWFEDNSEFKRHPVGTLKPNPWGLYDIYGNVSEWTLDQHDRDTYQRLYDQMSTDMASAINWPNREYGRVSKGGSWELPALNCRTAARLFDNKEWKNDDPEFPKSPWWYTSYPGTGVGIRLVRPLNVPSERKDQERFWDDVEKLKNDADTRIEANGRGAHGLVDKDLPEAIKAVKADGRRRPVKIK